MKIVSKNYLLVIGALIAMVLIGTLFVLGASRILAASPAGSTSQDAKQWSIIANFSNATTTYMLNNSGNDLLVTATKVLCENVSNSQTSYTGAGLASWQFTVGTTSTNVPGATVTRSAVQLLNAVAMSTSTQNMMFASSSVVTATSSKAMVWNANSYMAFQANATNTAQCTVGVDVTSS